MPHLKLFTTPARHPTGRRVVPFLLCLVFSLSAQALETRENSLGMRFVRIPAGEFTMGTRPQDVVQIAAHMEEPDASKFADEVPAHRVTLNEDFWLQQSEVTQAQWLQVMENRPGPAQYWQREDWRTLPVVSVSWFMAQRFIEELNKMDPQFSYRLPTEAEWEYAARAGSDGIRPHDEQQLTEYAWFIRNSGDEPHPVGTRKANAFGLFDMLGNAWEWVHDRYHPDTYVNSRRVDPRGPGEGPARVRRGGSYHCPLWQVRPAYRAADPPDSAYSVIGFRVVAQERR